MIRISKLTDYGIVLLTYFATAREGTVLTARDLSEQAMLPLPTVGKILKALSRGELLVSQRGVHGGYRLSKRPEEISIAQIISILEGPIAITECNTNSPGLCEFEEACPIKSNWQKINSVVHQALENLSLAAMRHPIQKRPGKKGAELYSIMKGKVA